MATITAGGQAKYLEGFQPGLPGFVQVPLGDLDAVRGAIGDQTAALLIEPIQAEGGIRQPENAFLQGLRQICDDNDLLLIFDEVQTGMGRSGKLFAYEQTGITPDIMTLAKGLGGGFPIGACLATARAASGMMPGTHGSTFGGNPLGCAVANAVLDVVLGDNFLPRTREVAAYLHGRLDELVARYPDMFVEVRGDGLLLGLRCVPTNADIVAQLMARGLLTVPAAENVVRLLPPLIIGRAEVDEAVAILDELCRESSAKEAAR
jgi:acetylornithine/N-succinyldiaminopimelate aminotransferase